MENIPWYSQNSYSLPDPITWLFIINISSGYKDIILIFNILTFQDQIRVIELGLYFHSGSCLKKAFEHIFKFNPIENNTFLPLM